MYIPLRDPLAARKRSMKSTLRSFIGRWILAFMDPRRVLSLTLLPRFLRDWHSYRSQSSERVAVYDLYPCLTDRTAQTPFDPHYFYQGAWIARKLATNRPVSHVDIASSVLTVSVFSAFVPTIFVDFRPLAVNLGNLECRASDITRLPFADEELASLSCLHVIEHIGLGRYGDALNAEGARNALSELQRVAAPGGRLYLSTPVGRERVCYNAHRVFDPKSIIEAMPLMKLVSFALVDDAGRFVENVTPTSCTDQEYSCGLFEFERRFAEN
jgi:SAM-dependent methyltransferase